MTESSVACDLKGSQGSALHIARFGLWNDAQSRFGMDLMLAVDSAEEYG